jgi:hypothetical protein
LITILRLTQHEPTEKQVRALKEAFGDDINIINYLEYIKSGDEVVELVEKYNADVVEVVLPLNLLNEVVNLLKDRVIIIRAIMERYQKLRGFGIIFEFSHYEIIEEVKVATRPLLPNILSLSHSN